VFLLPHLKSFFFPAFLDEGTVVEMVEEVKMVEVLAPFCKLDTVLFTKYSCGTVAPFLCFL